MFHWTRCSSSNIYMFLFSTLSKSKRDCGAGTNLVSLLKVSDVVLPDAVDVTALPWPKWPRQWLKASDRNLPPICLICAQPLQTHRVQQPQQPQSCVWFFLRSSANAFWQFCQFCQSRLSVHSLKALWQFMNLQKFSRQLAVVALQGRSQLRVKRTATLRRPILQSWLRIFQFNSNMAWHYILRKNVHKMQHLIQYKNVMTAFLCVLACGSMRSAIAEEPETV